VGQKHAGYGLLGTPEAGMSRKSKSGIKGKLRLIVILATESSLQPSTSASTISSTLSSQSHNFVINFDQWVSMYAVNLAAVIQQTPFDTFGIAVQITTGSNRNGAGRLILDSRGPGSRRCRSSGCAGASNAVLLAVCTVLEGLPCPKPPLEDLSNNVGEAVRRHVSPSSEETAIKPSQKLTKQGTQTLPESSSGRTC
jgi:hypothetical protein